MENSRRTVVAMLRPDANERTRGRGRERTREGGRKRERKREGWRIDGWNGTGRDGTDRIDGRDGMGQEMTGWGGRTGQNVKERD